MKSKLKLFVFLICGVMVAPSYPAELVFDRYLSPLTSTGVFSPVQSTLVDSVNSATPPDWDSVTSRTLIGIAWDVPVTTYLLTLHHEYFGHGSRAREFGYQNIQVFVDWPLYYRINKNGPSGYASWDYPNEKWPIEGVVVNAAGIEADRFLGKTIFNDAYARNQISSSQSLFSLFLLSDPIFYTIAKGDDVDSDPYRYVNGINQLYFTPYVLPNTVTGNTLDFAPPEIPSATLDQLKTAAYLSILSPSYLICWANEWSYFVSGTRTFSVPTWGPMDLFFDFHPNWTPFGLGWEFTFKFNRNSQIQLGLASNPHSHFYDLGYQSLVYFKTPAPFLEIGIDSDIWYQPPIDNPKRSNEFGGLLMGKTRWGLGNFSPLINLGIKSSGYYEPYPIGACALLGIGVAF